MFATVARNATSRRREYKRVSLEEATLALLVADGRVMTMGPAPRLDCLLGIVGLSRAGVVATDITVFGGALTILSVPSTAWRDPALKKEALGLARMVRAMGDRVLLVPETVIRREPRLTNARLIASCAHVQVTPRDRMAVMTRVIEQGGCTLSDCAEVVRANDKYGTVLAMISEGLIECSTSRPLLPWSDIRQATRR